MRRLVTPSWFAYAWLQVESKEDTASIEYALLASLIALVIITAVMSAGTSLTGVFDQIAASLH
jgi:Flp pilus assembly pilin Flp